MRRAAGYCSDIEFSPEDASRTELDFLCEVIEAAIDAGATTVNIPDTVGYATPAHMGKVIRTLCERVPNIDKAVVSMHCHDDLGLAVANSLSGIENGAGQIECTINGIGERAGNCSLEEVVMALRTRGDLYQADTRINSQRLVPTSRLVANITGLQVPRNKAIVGRNAFAHEAGIHQDGMLKERTTYEIMHAGRRRLSPRPTWCWASTADARRWPIGPRRWATRSRGEQLRDRVRRLQGAGRQEERSLRRRHRRPDRPANPRRGRSLVAGSATRSAAGTGQTPSVTLTLKHGDREVTETMSCGDGPIDAMFLAIEKITGVTTVCKDFRVQAVTVGKDAQAEVNVELEHLGRVHRGRGVSTDSLEASGRRS